MTWARWEGASRCTDGPEPGARALLAWLLESYPDGRSLGIFNCRQVRGASTRSLHSEGRAVDYGMPMQAGRGSPAGHEIVRRLSGHGGRLGIQTVIYDRTIWSARSPTGRPYTGQAPHFDHLHIELSREAARLITLATFRAVLGGQAGEAPAAASKEGAGSASAAGASTGPALGARVLRLTSPRMRGDDVREWQTLLRRWRERVGGEPRPVTVDGIFGPETRAESSRFMQAVMGVSTQDPLVGPRTVSALRAALG